MASCIDVLSDNRSEVEQLELITLARLVTFARESARTLNAEFPAYCLDLALGAIVEELQTDKDDLSAAAARVMHMRAALKLN